MNNNVFHHLSTEIEALGIVDIDDFLDSSQQVLINSIAALAVDSDDGLIGKKRHDQIAKLKILVQFLSILKKKNSDPSA